jgi:hypothetical protein
MGGKRRLAITAGAERRPVVPVRLQPADRDVLRAGSGLLLTGTASAEGLCRSEQQNSHGLESLQAETDTPSSCKMW